MLKKTEARSVLGLDRALKGQMEMAMDHLRWVRREGSKTSTEYKIACAELERMEAAKAGPGSTGEKR